MVEIIKLFKEKGVKVRFGIYFVVGCLFGYMNVLLVEVNVFYDVVLEMDEINEDFFEIDVVLVIGVNDMVNFSVLEDFISAIVGMLVLEVWKVK